ncbi:ECF-type sigma factor [Henriciella litoralis]|uniref:ECF-type sigma factor n=1 Tax=Henriciella litoralis TaxID=568102 RepID=UPI00111BD167|nr:ECF-type sigma factor [Henriciella litoralis]
MPDIKGNMQPEEGRERSLDLSDELLAETYDLLRRIASRQLAGRRKSATLNTTLIVHEAWLKLSHDKDRRFNDEDHYLATASRAMRQVLVDHSRRKLAEKRGGGAVHIDLDEYTAAAPTAESEIVNLDAALQDLARLDPDLERIVECRFFAGLTVNETARILGRSVRTIERDWVRARTYLAEYLDAGR